MSTYNILLVDDDPDFRKENNAALTADGFAVTEADGAASALELIKDKKFDLAIVDLMMERADSGFTLAYHMKQQYPEMPIVMVSSVNSEMGLHFSVDSAAERAWIKADAFINKPLRYEQLIAEVKQLLGITEAAH